MHRPWGPSEELQGARSSAAVSFATAITAAPLSPISAATLAPSSLSVILLHALGAAISSSETPSEHGVSALRCCLGSLVPSSSWGEPEPSGPYSTGLSPDAEPNVPGRWATHHLWCTRHALATSRSLLQTPRAFLPQGVQFSTV